MFNKNNFCHVASNNRNEQKAGLFVYKTTDDLDTVLASGYFNEKIIDINLHDVIIHVKTDPTDKTKVQQNVLCVTERTLDNVGTKVVLSQWEGEAETDLTEIEAALTTFVKKDGSSIMTGPLKFKAGSFEGAIAGGLGDGISIYKLKSDGSIDSEVASITKTNGLAPGTTNTMSIGSNALKWKDAYISRVFTSALNNGHDIAVPVTNTADTLALRSEIDLAANSGRMITPQGFWYAKMESGTVPPAAEDGTNYADFSQVDGNGDPIIVTYNRVSGAWVQDQTITPPNDYDGYVPITSKIWDIPEQTDQQGGRILWNHTSKEFTPYPTIISLDNKTLTSCNLVTCTITSSTFQGAATLSNTSTMTMPSTVTATSVANAGYVINRQNWQDISDETFVATAMEIDLADDKTMYFVDATADTEITIDSSAVSITAGSAKTFEIHVVCGATVPTITWQGIDAWLVDSETSPVEANKTSIFAIRVQQRPSDLTPTVVANYGGAY